MDKTTRLALAHVFMLAQSQHTEWSGICEGIAADQEDLALTEKYRGLAQQHDLAASGFKAIADGLMDEAMNTDISTEAAVKYSQSIISVHLAENTELADMLRDLARA